MGTCAIASHSYLHQILETLQSGVCALNFTFVCFFLTGFKGFKCLKYVYSWILVEMSHSVNRCKRLTVEHTDESAKAEFNCS